ncbi:MAG: HDOD domain-containing protein [Opitutaceae bacterium]
MFPPSLKEMFAVAAKLPAAPQVLAELAELLEDINADTAEIAALLKRDGPLAAAILRISNSAYYGNGGVGSVEAAVTRVGFSEVHRLTGFAATGMLAERGLRYYAVEAEQLREHMICAALAAEALATAAGLNPRHAYTSGLLRPIGMMVLDRMARAGNLPESEYYRPEDAEGYAQWETRVVQIRSSAVAGVVLSEWRFAPDVVEAVRGHALTAGATPPTPGAALLHLALGIVETCDHGLPGEAGRWTPSPEKLELAGIDEAILPDCAEEVRGLLDRMLAALV